MSQSPEKPYVCALSTCAWVITSWLVRSYGNSCQGWCLGHSGTRSESVASSSSLGFITLGVHQ